jgi:hypothetical protein
MKLSRALIAGLSLIALPLYAADLSDLSYITTDNKVTITGCDKKASGALIIPATIEDNPVTIIGGGAFADCIGLTSITIPDSVISIGNQAFACCTSLTIVTIPDSVISIGSSAFQGCFSLTSITISDSVISIGAATFFYCISLTSVTIPESVTSIEDGAFQGCSSLTSITIPDSVTGIGHEAFFECTNLTSITFLGAAPTVDSDTFSGVADGARALVTIEHLASFGDLGDDWNELTVSMSVHYLNDLLAQIAELSQRPTQVQYDELGDALVAMTADRDSRPTQVQYDALGDALVAMTADRDSRPTQASYDALGDALVAMTADRDSRPTLAEVQDARVGSIILSKDWESGEVSLCFGLQKTEDFVTWEAFEGGTWSEALNGEFKLTLPLGESKKWLRLTMPE